MNQTELIKLVEKGIRYKELHDSPTFRELVDELGSNAFHKWNTCPIEDKEAQFTAKLDFEASKRIFAFCKSHMIAGQNAQKELEKMP